MRDINWRPAVRSGHATRDSMSAAAVTIESPSAPAGGLSPEPAGRTAGERRSRGSCPRPHLFYPYRVLLGKRGLHYHVW
jgi:hypothetical protein